jgi:Helix-turn-helix domain
MAFTLAEAAKAVGRDKSTLARAVRTGRISAARDDDGVWRIDESELRRVYPAETPTPGAAVGATIGAAAVAAEDAPGALGDAPPDIGAMQQVLARLADAHDQIT